MSLIKAFIAAAVIWLLVSAAVTYGGIWQSQSNPMRVVATKLDGGQSEAGLLWHRWDTEWELLRNDGGRVDLGDLSSVSLEWQVAKGSPLGLLAFWRAWLPFGAVIAFLLIWLARGHFSLADSSSNPKTARTVRHV